MSSTNEAARYEAQRLAFSPLLFQACRVRLEVRAGTLSWLDSFPCWEAP